MRRSGDHVAGCTYADDYDRWFDEYHNGYNAVLSRIRQILPQPDSRSIEMGVGSGRFAAHIFKMCLQGSNV